MVMSSPHSLGIPVDYDQIHFPSQDCHLVLALLITNSYFQIFQDSQEDYYEFHDPITEWLEKSYLKNSFLNNRFRYFLKLAKKYNADEDMFARIFQGLFYYGLH